MSESTESSERQWPSRFRRALSSPPVLTWMDTIELEPYWGRHFHSTPTHELIHVLRGRARIEYRGRSFSVSPGDTFLVPQRTAHRDVRTQGKVYRAFYAFFQWPNASQLMHAMDPTALCSAPEAAKSQLQVKIKELQDEYLGDLSNARHRMNIILLEMLLAMSRFAQRPEDLDSDAKSELALLRRQRLAMDARQYLVDHCDQQIRLDELAKRYKVSSFHLCRTFTREFGISMTDMLTLIRVEKAKDLLESSELSMKEVSSKAGFTDPNYFAKVFRKASGRSPSQFRLSRTRGQIDPVEGGGVHLGVTTQSYTRRRLP